MVFDLNDTQSQIKETARDLLAARFTWEKVRELAEPRAYDEAVWKEVGELGWPGIAVGTEHGGQGLGTVELAVLCEEIGYACAPLPFLSTAAAALLIEAAGSDGQRAEWLPRLASGEARAGFGMTREGEVVADAEGADAILLSEGEGARLVTAAEAEVEPLELIDRTRLYARVSAGGGDPLPGDAEPAIDRIAVALAAELTGIAQRAMEMAVDYARDRQQFGRPIGAYQAVSHRCARQLYDVEESRSLTYYAAWAADAEPESLPLAASMAKARASEAAWQVTASALQVHGGIGFTWEHDLHFLLKRARIGSELLGTAREHRERVAALTGLGSPEPAVA